MIDHGTVTPLRRPPIRRSTLVRSSREHTFGVFVDTIGDWWPLQPYSLGGERVRAVAFDRREGGRVHETWDDGTERTWGHVLAWDPPAGFAMTWEVTPVTTEVELTFRALGPALTKVDVEHRGWELTDDQFAGAATGYAAGWVAILASLAAAAAPSDHDTPTDPERSSP